MDTDRLLTLAPHYVAIIGLMLLAIYTLDTVVENVHPLVDLGVMFLILLAYPTVVRALGIAPEFWEDPERDQESP